jgi:hypothetical protein
MRLILNRDALASAEAGLSRKKAQAGPSLCFGMTAKKRRSKSDDRQKKEEAKARRGKKIEEAKAPSVGVRWHGEV